LATTTEATIASVRSPPLIGRSVRIELLRAAAKLRALQLAQQMLQAVILRLQMIAFCHGGVPLRARLCQERLQRRDIGWQLRGGVAHARH
jgi:hypothetical protein